MARPEDAPTQTLELTASVVPPPPEALQTPLVAVRLPTLPGLIVSAELGRGGMGVVYRATQVDLHRLVAVKMLRFGSTNIERFHLEAAAVARLQHPNVVQVFEFGTTSDGPFVVLEHLAGGTLSERLAREPLGVRAAAELLRTLAQAMQHAHERGIVHRDLKPANILFADDGTPKIVDFGLARCLDDAAPLTASGAIVGTPAYMAPEQANGTVAGPAADIWALGVVLYECLTGRPPFYGATAWSTLDLVRAAEPLPPRLLQPSVPSDLNTICLKCLHREPARRYSSAAELAADLERYLAGQPIHARPVGWLERTLKWMRRNPWPTIMLFGAILVVLAGVGGVAWHTAQLSAALAQLTRQEEQTRQERDRAHADYQAARTALRSMLQRLRTTDLAGTPGLIALTTLQASDALAFFENATTRADSSAAIRLDMAQALTEAADLRRLLDQSNLAQQQIERARHMLELLVAEEPSAAHQHALADALLVQVQIGQGSVADFDRLRGLVAATTPHDAAGKMRLADVHHAQGVWHLNRGEVAAALKHHHAARTLQTAALAEQTNHNWASDLATTLVNLSVIYQAHQQDRAAAQAFFEQAEKTLLDLLERFPRHTRARLDLAVLRFNWAYVLMERKEFSLIEIQLTQSQGHLEAMLAVEPDLQVARDRLYRLHGVRATAYERQGRNAQAAAAWEQLRLYAPTPQAGELQRTAAMLWAKAGQHARAIAEARRMSGQPTWRQRMDWVEVCGWALAALGNDTTLTVSARKALHAEYMQLALEGVRAARAAAPPAEWAADRKRLFGNPAMLPLVLRNDFWRVYEGRESSEVKNGRQ
jgi:tetratricopeptide (TPR) repeat protein